MEQTLTFVTGVAAPIIGILILASLNEGLMEYFVAPWFERFRKEEGELEDGATDWRLYLLRYSSAAVGVLLCLAYQVDLLSILGLVSPVPYVGSFLTGLLIGRGANFVHDFASRWLAPKR